MAAAVWGLEERRLQGSWALRRALTLAGESDWDMVAGQHVGTSKQRQAKHGHGRRDETSPCATPKTTTLPHANLDGRAHIVSPLRRGAPSSSTPCVPLHGSALPRRSLLLRCSPGLIAVELRPHNNITAVTPPSHRICRPPRRPQQWHRIATRWLPTITAVNAHRHRCRLEEWEQTAKGLHRNRSNPPSPLLQHLPVPLRLHLLLQAAVAQIASINIALRPRSLRLLHQLCDRSSDSDCAHCAAPPIAAQRNHHHGARRDRSRRRTRC
jgi:hypothetical protein